MYRIEIAGKTRKQSLIIGRERSGCQSDTGHESYRRSALVSATMAPTFSNDSMSATLNFTPNSISTADDKIDVVERVPVGNVLPPGFHRKHDRVVQQKIAKNPGKGVQNFLIVHLASPDREIRVERVTYLARSKIQQVIASFVIQRQEPKTRIQIRLLRRFWASECSRLEWPCCRDGEPAPPRCS